MPQLTIYLPENIENKARKAAEAKGVSVSRWIAEQIGNSLGDNWSRGVLDAAGALTDFPELKEIRKGYGDDMLRELLE